MAAGGEEKISIKVDKLRDVFANLFEDDDFSKIFHAMGMKDHGAAGASSPRVKTLLDIPVAKVTAVLNAIDTIGIESMKFADNHLNDIAEFSNPDKYKNASFFAEQVTFAIYKLIQQKTADNPKMMRFEEVKRLLGDLRSNPKLADRMLLLHHYRADVNSPINPQDDDDAV